MAPSLRTRIAAPEPSSVLAHLSPLVMIFSPSPQDIFRFHRTRRFGAELVDGEIVDVDEDASPADPVPPPVQPELAKFVDERKRVFSVGLDPDVEQTAAEWFESLGYATLTGDVHYTKGFWGGVTTESDPRLGVSVCTGTSDVTLVDGYDFANWLPIPAVMDSLVLDYPDAKFLLFETPVDDWIRRVSVKAAEAARLGAKCGCVGEDAVRSPLPACGDATHHYCDVYPCLWEQQFATREVDPLAWREAYVNHVAKVKTSVPSERLLVVPMLADQSPVAVAQAVGSFVELTTTPEEFAAAHPFEPHIMDLRRERGWSVVLFVMVGVLGLALLFVPNPYAVGMRQSGYSSDFSH